MDQPSTVDSFYRSERLEQLVEVVHGGTVHFAGDLDLPGPGTQPPGVAGGIVLAGAELVVIVVAGHVLVRGELLVLSPPARHRERQEPARRGNSKSGGFEEFAPVPIQRFVGYLGGRNVGETADEHDFSLGPNRGAIPLRYVTRMDSVPGTDREGFEPSIRF
jgi:hypothetical protein